MAALRVADKESAVLVLWEEQFLLRLDSFYFAEIPSVTTHETSYYIIYHNSNEEITRRSVGPVINQIAVFDSFCYNPC